MNKEEFLTQLGDRLSGLPREAVEDRLSYYAELVDHRMEGGMTEAEAVASIGSLNETVGQIMHEIPLTKLMKRTMDPKRETKVWKVVLILLTLPIWLPLLISLFAIVLSIGITFWALVVAFFFVGIGIAAVAVFGLFVAIGYVISGKAVGGLFFVGIALILVGLSIVIFLLSIGLARGLAWLTAKTALFVKSLFVRQEKESEVTV
ncbi:MAG: DUF1700 domain-containing protein [Lachnospiraceae bacterium]|nr:DUF1700 domain-containing protein [Lachnospiraceae bacterium]